MLDICLLNTQESFSLRLSELLNLWFNLEYVLSE